MQKVEYELYTVGVTSKGMLWKRGMPSLARALVEKHRLQEVYKDREFNLGIFERDLETGSVKRIKEVHIM